MNVFRVAALCAVFSGFGGGFASSNDIHEACRDGRINARSVLDSWFKAGVVRDFSQRDGSATMYVSTPQWERIGPKAQISIGIAAYCFVTDHMGRGYVEIAGSQQEKLGTVLNGNWSPRR